MPNKRRIDIKVLTVNVTVETAKKVDKLAERHEWTRQDELKRIIVQATQNVELDAADADAIAQEIRSNEEKRRHG